MFKKQNENIIISKSFISFYLLMQIRPFKNAYVNRATDQELVKLSVYLEFIAEIEDFTSLDHRNWEKFSKNARKRGRDRISKNENESVEDYY